MGSSRFKQGLSYKVPKLAWERGVAGALTIEKPKIIALLKV
jgi:hypothetical protein